MFDINTINKRYFNIKINDVVLDIEPPSKKTLSKILSLTKDSGSEAIDGLYAALEMILNKNKTGYKINSEVIEELDMDQVSAILNEYFKWLKEVRNSPN